jgi:hypothetical protein
VGVVPTVADTVPFALDSTTLGAYSNYPNSLVTVDPAGGTQQLVGQPGQAAGLSWLTADPIDGMLYGTGAYINSGTPLDEGTLYAINPNSGAVSGTVSLSQNVSAIATSPKGVLYGLSGNALRTINAATGQFSSVGTLSLSPGYYLAGMAFSPGGTLYGVAGGLLNQQLITIDPATGAMASDLGSLTGAFDVGDITYAADGNIYASNFSYALLKIDPQTLSNTFVGFGNVGDLGGIAAVAAPSVPEPSTLALMGTSIAVMGTLLWFGRGRPKSNRRV